MFKDSPEGRTHFEEDHCGIPEHNCTEKKDGGFRERFCEHFDAKPYKENLPTPFTLKELFDFFEPELASARQAALEEVEAVLQYGGNKYAWNEPKNSCTVEDHQIQWVGDCYACSRCALIFSSGAFYLSKILSKLKEKV